MPQIYYGYVSNYDTLKSFYNYFFSAAISLRNSARAVTIRSCTCKVSSFVPVAITSSTGTGFNTRIATR